MHRLVRVSILLALVATLGPSAVAMGSQAAQLPDAGPQAQTRLVVFEGFLRPG